MARSNTLTPQGLMGALSPPKKLRRVVVWPDGRRYVLRRKDGAWWWSDRAGSSPLSAAIANVEELGGRVILERI